MPIWPSLAGGHSEVDERFNGPTWWNVGERTQEKKFAKDAPWMRVLFPVQKKPMILWFEYLRCGQTNGLTHDQDYDRTTDWTIARPSDWLTDRPYARDKQNLSNNEDKSCWRKSIVKWRHMFSFTWIALNVTGRNSNSGKTRPSRPLNECFFMNVFFMNEYFFMNECVLWLMIFLWMDD